MPDNWQILTRAELVTRVGQLASRLSRLGVVRGDRAAGYLPNRFETLIAFLATASLGAIWSNCPPELSSRAAVDRLAQIEPKVLVAVSGYRYRRQELYGLGKRQKHGKPIRKDRFPFAKRRDLYR